MRRTIRNDRGRGRTLCANRLLARVDHLGIVVSDLALELPEVEGVDQSLFTEKERAFIFHYLTLHVQERFEPQGLREEEITEKAALLAGYKNPRVAGWNTVRTRKIWYYLTKVCGAEVMANKFAMLQVMKTIALNEGAPSAVRLKAVTEWLAMDEDLKKVQEVKIAHQQLPSGQRLDDELSAMFERHGVRVIDGGKLEPMPMLPAPDKEWEI